jgi:CheY-like chemotaxis protein
LGIAEVDDQNWLRDELAETARATVLVIQKDVGVRTYIAELLRDEGYTCIESASADEALDILDSHIRVDLILTSMRWPGPLDRGELVLRIRTRYPYIKILMVSAVSPAPAVCRVLDGFVIKPFQAATLVHAVQALVPALRDQADSE